MDVLDYYLIFLSIRKFRIKANGLTRICLFRPTIFIIAINDVLKGLQPPLNSDLYADDLVIFVKSKSIKNCMRIAPNFLYKLENWSQEAGYSFSILTLPNRTQLSLYYK